jgi:predicted O-methyltransferase YrrM
MTRTDPNAVLREIETQAQHRFLPIIGPIKGKYLAETVRKYKVRTILEVGTLVGYSAILMAKNLPEGGKIHTIEIDPRSAAEAKVNIEKAGFSDMVVQYIGNALDVIPTIDETFDMAFLDAAKDEYMVYLKIAEPKLKKGGVVFADNVKMFASAMKDFLDYVRNSGRYRSQFIDVGFDGDEISVKLF